MRCSMPAALSMTQARGRAQYSVFFLSPGMGMGYMPSASACTGAGESIVNLSTPGAYSSVGVEHLLVGDLLRRMGRLPAQGTDETGLDAVSHLVERLVVADRVDQVVPFVLDTDCASPESTSDCQIICGRVRLLALVGAGGRSAVAVLGDDRRALGAVGVAGVEVVRHPPCSAHP